MAIGKNKRISKGRKGGKKKAGDSFLKKEWYDLKAPPTIFTVKGFGKTIASKTVGTKLSVDSLKGRIYEVNLADLNKDEEHGYRKIKLCCEDVQGKACLTDFHGMDMTRNHLCSLIRKWHSLIEAHVDVKTSDGYSLRVFCIAFTQRRKNQVKSTCYIQTSKAKMIRKRMKDVITAECGKSSLHDLVKKFALQTIEKAIDKQTKSIFPLQNIYIRKVKVLKKAKFDIAKLMELHAEGGDEWNVSGGVIGENPEAQNILSAEIKPST